MRELGGRSDERSGNGGDCSGLFRQFSFGILGQIRAYSARERGERGLYGQPYGLAECVSVETEMVFARRSMLDVQLRAIALLLASPVAWECYINLSHLTAQRRRPG